MATGGRRERSKLIKCESTTRLQKRLGRKIESRHVFLISFGDMTDPLHVRFRRRAPSEAWLLITEPGRVTPLILAAAPRKTNRGSTTPATLSTAAQSPHHTYRGFGSSSGKPISYRPPPFSRYLTRCDFSGGPDSPISPL